MSQIRNENEVHGVGGNWTYPASMPTHNAQGMPYADPSEYTLEMYGSEPAETTVQPVLRRAPCAADPEVNPRGDPVQPVLPPILPCPAPQPTTPVPMPAAAELVNTDELAAELESAKRDFGKPLSEADANDDDGDGENDDERWHPLDDMDEGDGPGREPLMAETAPALRFVPIYFNEHDVAQGYTWSSAKDVLDYLLSDKFECVTPSRRASCLLHAAATCGVSLNPLNQEQRYEWCRLLVETALSHDKSCLSSLAHCWLEAIANRMLLIGPASKAKSPYLASKIRRAVQAGGSK